MARDLIERLRRSDEPSIRWRVRVGVLDEDPDGRSIRRLREEIRTSRRARQLIDGEATHQRRPDGGLRNVYTKWQGAHWALLSLSELGYPEDAPELAPMVAREVKNFLGPAYFREYDPADVPNEPGANRLGVKVINGRHRRCASQQGAALLSTVRLGHDSGDDARLVERLTHWQWPDGGWNCRTDADTRMSSLYETLLPMRGLAAYARKHRDRHAADAARRAADVLLARRLIYRRTDGRLIRSDWARLHYLVYWRYDVLSALIGLAEAGLVGDARCDDALDLLERKELPGGGWAAEAKYYSYGGDRGRRSPELVDWGGVDPGRMNEWVTVNALAAMKAAGRL